MSRMIALLDPTGAPNGDWLATEPWMRLGRRTLWAMSVVLVLSATVISISGAVVATGSVTVESSYKSVQHLDGGIVSKIHVKNGDRVAEGDVLISLDDTAAKANLAVVVGRVNDYRIQQARLEAERDGKATFTVPADIDVRDESIAKIVETQTSLFRARKAAHDGERSVLSQRVTQLKGDISGLGAQLTSSERQLDITSKELASVLPLLERGFVNQQRIGTLQRDSARLEGDVGRLTSEIAKAQSAIAEAELKLAQSEKDNLSQIAEELRKTNATLAENEEQAKGLADKVARARIRAPRSGRVHALAAHTEGGVITPASTILQIIPDGEKLIVEANIPPQEIDKVHAQQAAHVKFSAFNARTTPRLEGFVSSVSPAQITDPQTQKSWFVVQVEVPASELQKLGPHELVPGMPAELFIETQSRSMLSYFMKPFTDIAGRMFREG